MPDTGQPAAHVSDTVADLAALHTEHHEEMRLLERSIRRVTRSVGRPIFLIIFLLIVLSWTAINVIAAAHGRSLEMLRIPYIDEVCALLGVCITILILITQRRDDALAERREQLTLQLAVISDRKSAKIIALVEELRRDLPGVSDRHDEQAQEMAEPDKPQELLEAIRESHGKPSSGIGKA